MADSNILQNQKTPPTPEQNYKKALRTLHTFAPEQGWNVESLIASIKIITEEADPSLIPKPDEEQKP